MRGTAPSGSAGVQAAREAELLQSQVDADVVELLLQRDRTGGAQAIGEERAELGERVARRVGVLLDVARGGSQHVVDEVHGDRAVGCRELWHDVVQPTMKGNCRCGLIGRGDRWSEFRRRSARRLRCPSDRGADHDYPRARATMGTDQHTDRDGPFFDLAPTRWWRCAPTARSRAPTRRRSTRPAGARPNTSAGRSGSSCIRPTVTRRRRRSRRCSSWAAPSGPSATGCCAADGSAAWVEAMARHDAAGDLVYTTLRDVTDRENTSSTA